MLVKCAWCGCEFQKKTGCVNRARKIGAPLFCNKTHAGLARRKNRSKEEKVSIKAEYDKRYRENNKDELKAKKHEYFVRTYDKEKARIERKKRMHKHIEYCRRPEYRARKKEYDKVHRAKQNYGELWESSLILNEIETLIDNKVAKQLQGLINKTTKRKRKWQQ